MGVIIALILFMLLVVVHEFGHFIAAKICGVGVTEFSVGMGPVIFKKTYEGTQYSLRSIPLGGYCRLAGEDESDIAKNASDYNPDDYKFSESGSVNTFNNAAWYKKLFISFLGPFNNILLCIIVLFFVFFYTGSPSSTLKNVVVNSPAEAAGIMAGDTIIAVNDVESTDWYVIVNEINKAEGKINLKYERGGKVYSSILTPEFNDETGRKMVGISCSMVHSPKTAISETFSTCTSYFKELWQFFKDLAGGHTEDAEVVGIVGIVGIVSEEAQYGMLNVIYIIGLFSLNLAFVNLLPIPGLDGGKILITILRVLSGGRISEEAEKKVDLIGLAILFALAIFLIFKDTFNLLIK